MLLFLAIALSILWISGCVLGLALGAMLARADDREPASPGRRRRRHAHAARPAAVEGMLPTA
jgi:hypothetical protein